jgi:cobalt-zinc-cadmium efflux system protein
VSKTFPSLPHSIPDLRGLWIAIITSLFVLCIKLYVGITTGSYALITDSAHIFIDCSSLGIALLSLTTSKKLQQNNLFTKEKEFSIVKKQLLSAKINAILLAVFSIWILLEMFVFDEHSHSEFGHSDHHEHSLILFAAIFGIIAYLVSAFLMRNTTNLAARGAYIHLIADIMSSISIVIATIVMMYTHIEWIDKVLSTFIVYFLLYNAQKLYRTTRKKEIELQLQQQK